MPPMGRILSLSALLHVSAATPFLTAPLGLPEGAKMKIGPAYSPIALKFPEHAPTTADPCAAPCGLKTCGTVADVACATLADAFGCSCDGCCRAAAPAPAATIEEPVGPNVELANRTHPGRGLEFATVPGRMTYSGNAGVNIDGGSPEFNWRDFFDLMSNLEFCTNTCMFPNDGACDDGGPGMDFSVCALGTDCNDCGARTSRAPEPPCGTNEHVSNGKCVACPPGTTSDGGDDPSEGLDTGCECARTVTLGPWGYKECSRHLTSSNTHDFNPANGELVVHACVDTIHGRGFTFTDCAEIKKVTFLHTVSNPVTIGQGAFRNSGVEVVDVPPRATFKIDSLGYAAALQRLVFRDDSDYSALKFEAGALRGSGLTGKEVLLCAPLIRTSMPPSD